MWDETRLAYWGAALVAHTPTLIVQLATLYCCVARMHRFPRECKLVMAVVFLSWFGDCVWPPVAHQILTFLNREGIVDVSRPLWVIGYTVPSSLIASIVWGLLLLAVFGKGRTRTSRYLVEGSDAAKRR
jgi:hypothetical protein